MTDTPEPFLMLDLGDAGDLSFDTAEEFSQWFNNRKNYLMSSLGTSNKPNAQKARSHLNARLGSIQSKRNEIMRLEGQGRDVRQIVSQLPAEFHQAFHNAVWLLQADSPKSQFLDALKDEDPDEFAAILCLLLEQQPDHSDPSTYRGAVKLALFEKGIADNAENQAKALEEVYRDGKRYVQELKDAHKRLQQVTEQLELANQELSTEARESHKSIQEDHERALQDTLAESQEKLAAHEEAYSEKLALHSAVQYWKNQEDRHWKKALVVGIGFAVSLAAAASLLFYFSNRLFAGEITPQKIGAILLTVSPIFWGLRVLARLLLSYMHLSTDAAERQIMIETFLALHKEGKIEEDDREFLLATIFRPTTTGIVRDDAAPVWSDLISKLSGR